MSLIASLKSSWYLGRGSRSFRKGNYEQALRYFLSSLEIARQSSAFYECAIRQEVVAETYLKLKQYDSAKSYANESINMNKKHKTVHFEKSINRLYYLLDKIKLIEEQDQQK